jgi:thioredoxin-like negative regulator of GroEL
LTATHDNLLQADEALGQLRIALDEGRVDDAVAFGREAVAAAPRYLRAIAGLAAALKTAGDDAEARRVLDAVPANVLASPRELVALAEICLNQGAEGTAKEMLRTALEAEPTQAETAELLARLLFSEGDVAGVVAVSEPFRLRGKATPTLLRMLAAAYEQSGDLATAAERAQAYAQAAYLDPHAHYHLATLEHRRGDIREAMRRYQLALTLSGGDDDLASAASDGVRALDALQLRQVTALAAHDPAFRLNLSRDLREALDERGFALSDEGLAVLATMDIEALIRHAIGRQGHGYH